MEPQSTSEEHATAAERKRASKSTRASLVHSLIAKPSSRRGHANLLCTVPLAHDPLEAEGEFRESRKSAATMKRARGDEEDADRTSRTHEEGELMLCRSLEEPIVTFLLSALLRVHGKEQQAAALMQGELTKLDLGGCLIGDDGAKIVADFLKHNETVKIVYLASCNIGPRGAKTIAESLKHNQTLWYLNLADHQIGDEGAEALIDALNYNVCMEWFHVQIARKFRATIKYLSETRNKISFPPPSVVQPSF